MVKIVRLFTGEEIIANVTENKTEEGITYLLKDPCVLVPSQEGKLLFVKWIPYADIKEGITLNRKDTVFCVPPLSDLEDHFTSVVTNNLFIPSKKVATPNLSLVS